MKVWSLANDASHVIGTLAVDRHQKSGDVLALLINLFAQRTQGTLFGIARSDQIVGRNVPEFKHHGFSLLFGRSVRRRPLATRHCQHLPPIVTVVCRADPVFLSAWNLAISGTSSGTEPRSMSLNNRIQPTGTSISMCFDGFEGVPLCQFDPLEHLDKTEHLIDDVSRYDITHRSGFIRCCRRSRGGTVGHIRFFDRWKAKEPFGTSGRASHRLLIERPRRSRGSVTS